MPPFKQRITDALDERLSQGLYRQRTCLEREQRHIVSDNNAYLNFSSNDYLGLAQSPELIEAWQQGLARFGTGSGASPLVTGYHAVHREFETMLAQWLGYERALLFSSGFSANQALLFSLLQKGDYLLQDKLNHASLMEAGMLSGATMRRFAHNDSHSLSALLDKLPSDAHKLVVTEGVFSMDGDLAPLEDLQSLCQRSGSMLVVDDAHGCGVLGEAGRGSSANAGIVPDIIVVTFGKAFGLQGAAILCDHDVAEYLVQFARHYIYSTSIPPAQAYALSKACQLIQQQQWRRDKLAELDELLIDRLDPAIRLMATSTPIKPLLVGESDRALQISAALREKGLWVSAIRPPTVPVHSARLRITLTASHQQDEIKQLAEAINEVFYRE
ncbi:8-amino-7-oxononanoate synthase [Photobacterium nomapromontoriensis]|uniref:8-amino-7-oxononanoate synthase n=1 Tax=Photobacterium nomapromontoriensis TaxID=2910237 RepID=UPI003D147150